MFTPWSGDQLCITAIWSVVLAVIVWRRSRKNGYKEGYKSYLADLRRKHFSLYGSEKEAVERGLNDIARELGEQYQRRNSFVEMGKVGEKKPISVEIDLGKIDQTIFTGIVRLWARRHEAEATAKLLGHGKLVDEIHDKGIPMPVNTAET